MCQCANVPITRLVIDIRFAGSRVNGRIGVGWEMVRDERARGRGGEGARG